MARIGFRLGLIIISLVQVVLLTYASQASISTASAQQSRIVPGVVNRVEIDPNDNSVWVLWNDATPGDFVINHFNSEGKRLSAFRFPGLLGAYNVPDISFFLGFDFQPDAPRLYYFVIPGNGRYTEHYILEFDLKAGTSRHLADKADLGGCEFYHFGPYNPVAKHIYLGCTKVYEGSTKEERTIVIDATTGKIIKTLDKGIVPVLVKSDLSRIYAKKYPANKPDQFSVSTFNIITLDAKNEQYLNEPELGAKFGGFIDTLDFLDIDLQTGRIYLQLAYTAAKITRYSQYMFDRDYNKLFETHGIGNHFIQLNPAVNQLYGFEEINVEKGGENTARNLNNPQEKVLARFDWELWAVDKRGLIYAKLDTRFKAYYSPEANADPGLGLVVINPQTFSVVRFLPLRAPDDYFASKAARLAAPPAGFKGRFFGETGHTLDGKFRDYWEKNGGLARFGYPITEPFVEHNPQLNRDLTVQYFERNRFELHPENANTPYEVLLGVLGRSFSATTGQRPEGSFKSGETIEVPSGVRFLETGHTLTGKFYEYWKANGGLAQHGLPLTEPTEELNPIDGKSYVVQYFERSRLELHPENAGTQYEVLMGHFGVQLLRARGWNLSF